MALVSSLVAKIETPTNKGKKIGTGYPVSAGYIITAYHIFSNIDDLSDTNVYWQRNDDVKDGKKTDKGIAITEIIYQSKKYDLVIAKCPTPDHTNSVHWCSFKSLKGNWESIGYAKSGQDHKRKTRLKDSAGGAFFKMLDDDWILQLESKGNASKVELWRGMSGAPVFLQDTNTLVAIITETPRKDKTGKAVHKDRLYATSIPYLLEKCSDFKQKIQFENDIEIFLENATTLLKDEALVAVFTQHDKTMPSNAFDLCRYLSHQPVRDFLRLITTLQQYNEQKKSALGELVCTLLPHLFDDEKATEIRTGIGDYSCPLVAVSYSSPVSVEMLMAKVDYRQAQIEKFTQKDFKAKYRLPLPPDSADDAEAIERDITADVYHQFAGDQQCLVVENITRKLYDKEVEQGILEGGASDEQEKVDFVKDTLADRAEDEDSSYYFIVDVKKMGGEEHVNQFANALKNIYPHCAIVYCQASRQIKRQELRQYKKLRYVLSPYLTMDKPL